MQGVKTQKQSAVSDTAIKKKLTRGKVSYGRYRGGVAELLRVGALM